MRPTGDQDSAGFIDESNIGLFLQLKMQVVTRAITRTGDMGHSLGKPGMLTFFLSRSAV